MPLAQGASRERARVDTFALDEAAALAGNSAMPAVAPRKRANDMKPDDWRGLIRGLIKFFTEEAQEPEHAEDDAGEKTAAGIVFMTPDGRVLLLRRADDEQNYGGHWSLPGGKAEKGETPEEAADREATEEIGVHPPGGKQLLDKRATPNGFTFHTFIKPVGDQFKPTLNAEHTDHRWAKLDNLPEPLHPAVRENLHRLRDELGIKAQDEAGLAGDELGSVREIDRDGHMHIARTPITRAVVSDYFGREINGWKRFSLDPDRKYALYRDLDELKKGANSFIGKPVLLRHKPSTAEDHPRDITVGAIGGPLEFDGDTLFAPLTIWDAEAIQGIENGTRRGLSCGYRYEADMTPGTAPDGTRYDGRMMAIDGNHLAIIPEPRVQGAMVADSADGFDARNENGPRRAADSTGETTETTHMTNAHVARRLNVLKAFFGPRLAKDQSLDGLDTLLALDAEASEKEAEEKRARDEAEEKERKDAADKRARDKRARDGENDRAEERNSEEEKAAADRKRARDAKRAMDRKARDESAEGIKAMLKEKLSGDEFKKACDSLERLKAMDEDDEEDEAMDRRARDARHAMDEATVDAKITAAREQERRVQAGIYEARTFVKPWVGELPAMAFDSAEDVYGAALKARGVKTDGVHPSAYRAILEMAPKPGDKPASQRPALAMDSTAKSAAAKFAPGIERIRVGA